MCVRCRQTCVPPPPGASKMSRYEPRKCSLGWDWIDFLSVESVYCQWKEMARGENKNTARGRFYKTGPNKNRKKSIPGNCLLWANRWGRLFVVMLHVSLKFTGHNHFSRGPPGIISTLHFKWQSYHECHRASGCNRPVCGKQQGRTGKLACHPGNSCRKSAFWWQLDLLEAFEDIFLINLWLLKWAQYSVVLAWNKFTLFHWCLLILLKKIVPATGPDN